jgi:hypothetical protein
MAANTTSNDDIQDSIQVALDAADTAAGVSEEFNNLKEQFEVVNVQAKRIYNSVLIIFLSAIVAGVVSLGAALLMYYKTLGTLQSNANVSIEALAIFTENVAKLDKSLEIIESNAENQDVIKTSLDNIKSASEKASTDLSGAENRYSKAIKISVKDTENLIKQFATTTLESIQSKNAVTQEQLSSQISNIEQFFQKKTAEESTDNVDGDSIVTYRQFQVLENKVDQLMMLQKELTANIIEMNRTAKAAALKRKAAPKKVVVKPAPNPFKLNVP